MDSERLSISLKFASGAFLNYILAGISFKVYSMGSADDRFRIRRFLPGLAVTAGCMGTIQLYVARSYFYKSLIGNQDLDNPPVYPAPG